MARPLTNTVIYFSHDADASEKKTLTIIKGVYGLEGIGFWWTLLEWLAKTENHYLDMRIDSDLEFLVQKLGLSLQLGTEILNKLSSLSAVDSILWEHRVIWCQNLVNRLDGVYKKRGRPLPLKPSFCDSNCKHTIVNPLISGTETSVSGTESTQSKVKDSKVKDSKEETNKENSNGIGKIFELFDENFQKITTKTADMINDYIEEYGTEKVIYALDEAVKYNKRNLKYVEGILKGNGKNQRDNKKLPTEYEEYSDPELEAEAAKLRAAND
jgi:DnaD/phage-associated family protein